MKKLQLIIDCDSVTHAAFYTMGDLSYRSQRTGVMFGFLLRTLSLAKKFGTGDVVFCWDSDPRKSKRKKIYPKYKYKRHNKERTDEEEAVLMLYRQQVGLLRKEVLPAMGFTNIYHRSGYEADDLIAACVIQNQIKKNLMIVTPDLDMLGCIGYATSLYDLHKKVVYDKQWFNKAYLGFDPWWWWEAKSISGCGSDGVKGIRGVADPAKTKASPPPVFKYLKGELKGKIVDKINSVKGGMIVRRNRRLIYLPFVEGDNPFVEGDNKARNNFLITVGDYKKHIRYSDNNVTVEGLSAVFRKYSFRHFLKGEVFNDWKRLFIRKRRKVIVRGK